MIVHLKRAIPVEILRFPRKSNMPMSKNDNYIIKAKSLIGEAIEDTGPTLLLSVTGVIRGWSDGTYDVTEPFVIPCRIRLTRENIDAIES